jgi:hypothetical protein
MAMAMPMHGVEGDDHAHRCVDVDAAEQPLACGQQDGAGDDDRLGADLVVDPADERGDDALDQAARQQGQADGQGAQAHAVLQEDGHDHDGAEHGGHGDHDDAHGDVEVVDLERAQVQQVGPGLAEALLAGEEEEQRDDADGQGNDRGPGACREVSDRGQGTHSRGRLPSSFHPITAQRFGPEITLQ